MNLLRSLSSLVVLGLLLFGIPEQAITQNNKYPVVLTTTGFGSSIVFQPNGLLTAKHVVAKHDRAALSWNGKSWEITKYWEGATTNDYDDVAVMVSSVFMEVPLQKLASCSDTVVIGDPIRIAGLLHEDEHGKVLAIVRGIIYHTGMVIPGDSGGPLWNSEGKVIGMTIGYIGDWNMAIHFKLLLRAIGQPCVTERGERAYLENPEALLDAIRKAEGVPSWGNVVLARRYGGHKHVPEQVGRDITARLIHKRYRQWVQRGKPGKFLEFLSASYAPLNAINDRTTRLNRYWKRNVERYLP